jgi:hypothetical protein
VLLGALLVVGLVLAPHSAHRLHHDLSDLGAWGPVGMIALAAIAVLVAMAIGGAALLWHARSKASAHESRAEENPVYGEQYRS